MNSKEFLKYWQGKADAPESKLAQAHESATADFEIQHDELLKSIRPQKTSKGLIAVFAPSAEEIAPRLEEAEKHLKEVEADIVAFLKLTDCEGLNRLVENLSRTRRAIDNSALETKNVMQRAMAHSGLSALEAERLEVVQASLDKRDRIKAELKPKLDDLQSRVSKAKEILERYANQNGPA